MTKHTVFVTGAGGEMGHSLIKYLAAQGDTKVVALDLSEGKGGDSAAVEYVKGDVRDQKLIADLAAKYDFDTVFHLAAILSTGGEKDPMRAHNINVDGSLNILSLARTVGERTKRSVKFIFPSTIAIYGIPTPEAKAAAGDVTEDQFLTPITMYGMNKLYIEHLGRYYDSYYRYLENPTPAEYVDFRAIRFPGILSAETVPTGGTSDYGPEMLHYAAQGKAYECFVGQHARIPFMVMPDAVRALIGLANAPRASLRQRVYNVTAFAPSAREIEAEIKKYFPKAAVTYKPHAQRFSIVESWPQNTSDLAARRDWGWKPEYDFRLAFEKYLVPAVIRRYESKDVKKASGC